MYYLNNPVVCLLPARIFVIFVTRLNIEDSDVLTALFANHCYVHILIHY